MFATPIMASATSREGMISLIHKQSADAHLKNILCVVHFVTQAAISCHWSGKISVTTPILRPLSMSRDTWVWKRGLSLTLLPCFRGSAPVLSVPDHHETKGFPAATTRDVSSTIGCPEGHGAGGLTSRRMGAEVPNTLCCFLWSQF